MALLEEVVKIKQQRLAKGHPSRLASQHNLATLYWKIGDPSASFQIMKHFVAVRRQVLDDDHPDRTNPEVLLEYFWRKS